MNLTKKTTVKFGQTDDVEKAYKKFDEVVALVQQAVKEPEHTGNYFDYVELCKLYDKNENGTMMLAELETFLSLMGDEIPKDDCTKLLDELAGAEDEDGFFAYGPFLDKLCGKAKKKIKTQKINYQIFGNRTMAIQNGEPEQKKNTG